MKEYVSLSVLVFLSVSFMRAEDSIERAIRGLRTGELATTFSHNVILRASDKERYIKLAREIVEGLKPVYATGRADENPLIRDLVQQQAEINRALQILGRAAGGLTGGLLAGACCGLVLLKNPWLKIASLLVGSSAVLGFYMVLQGLSKIEGNEGIYFRAYAILKMLEDMPVAKE